MEKAVGYEIRRRIRAQIRIVKRLISEGKLSTATTVTKLKSLNKDSKSTTRTQGPTHTEYQTKFTTKTTPDTKKVDNKMYSHTEIINKKDSSERVSEYQSSYTYDERRSSSQLTQEEILRRSRSRSPEEKPVPQQKTAGERKPSKPELKKAPLATKTVTEEKPEWVTQRNLKKVATTKTPSTAKVSTTTTTTRRTQETVRSSPPKETKSTDVITSSYGVGPLDENGIPLFGLKALRAQNKNTKMQGTVVRSEFYSENGQEPIGEVSVTKYSTDPQDLDSHQDLVKSGDVVSVTTTQKFGQKGTPSLKNVVDKKKVS